MKVGVVIPAYNVGDKLEGVLSKVLTYVSASNVYVVNDGSTDSTAEIATEQKGVLFQHVQNKGKGEALKTGFKLALADGCEGIITLDGDGQHDPELVPRFIRTMETTKSDVVLGIRRFELGRMPLDRIFSNVVSSWVVSLFVRRRIRDSQCGYRLYGAHVLKGIAVVSRHYEVETELLIKIVRKGWTISYCRIPLIYGNYRSYVRRFADTLRFCRTLLRLVKDR